LNKKTIIAICLIFTILIVDQIFKIWVKTSFELNQPLNVFGDWFRLLYIENQGMAFGTTFGSGWWAKLALSLFRLVAIIGLTYYLIKQLKFPAVRTEYIVAISLVLAGATGNLIDSAFYDFVFEFDETSPFNWVQTSDGTYTLRKQGFLFANVVDMFQFNARWPQWVPWLGGEDVFGAIWNVADASITCGVIMVLIRQRTYFPSSKKKKEHGDQNESEEMQSENEESKNL